MTSPPEHTPLLDRLRASHILVCDGAWGTMLLERGFKLGECPERWNVERRDEVLDIARAYVDAGADLIQTNSFGGNRFRLSQFGLQDEVAALNEAAAAISREAADGKALVFASMGPSGFSPRDESVSEEVLYDAFCEQAQALAHGGADALLVETMSDLREARAAVLAARASTKLEVGCTFTFRRMPDGTYLSAGGATPAEMVHAMLAVGARVVGANCMLGPQDMVGLIAEIRRTAPDTPILAQPNAGQPVPSEYALCYAETPDSMAAWSPALLRAGANLIGGCCGIGPAHIRAIRQAIA